jgi:hypothetical protein
LLENTMHRRRTLVALIRGTLCLAIAACGAESSTSALASPAGSYALATVNGQPLPQLVAHTATGDLEVMSATLVLREDHSYASAYRYRAVASPSTTFDQSATGTWSVSGSTVTYSPTGSSPTSVTTMRWQEPTLTLVDANGSVPATLLFRK